MKDAGPGLIVALTGVLLARLLVTGEASFFVGPLVRPLLFVLAPVLIALGAWQVLACLLGAGDVHQHQHQRGGKVSALLIVPLAIVLAGPQPLSLLESSVPSAAATPPPVEVDPESGKVTGGYGGQSNDPNEYGSTRNGPIGQEPDSYPALTGDPAEIGMYDYVERSSYGKLSALTGRKLSIVGFVSRDPDNPKGPWVLARLKMWCCAADALPYLVTAIGGPPPVPYGSWVRVIGTELPGLPSGDARFKIEKVEPIGIPQDPYLW